MLTLELGGSANTYQGDLNNFAEKWAGNLSIALRYTQFHKVHFGLTVKTGNVMGQNIDFKSSVSGATPNKNFETSFTLAYVDGQLNLWKPENEYYRAFFTLGAGLMNFRPKDDRGRNLLDLSQTRDTTENYSSKAFFVPMGLGFQYHFKNRFGVGTSVLVMNPFTKYLDNIGKWGNDKFDNLLMWNFYVTAPLLFKQSTR
ncbi:MAG: hypothetical protein OHK0038_19330 [Flammeovirgaceae bacterium]